jgi:hypothetical protein
MLPIKKVYVDTKYKTKDSKSNANFKFELPETLYMPDNTVFYIDDVAIPHSWYTVEDFNDKLYFRVSQGGGHNDYVIALTKQLYNGQTLATEIQTKLTEIGYTPTVTYNAAKQTIFVSLASFNFQFLTDTELQSPSPAWNGAGYDINNLNSANELIKNTEDTSTLHNAANPLVTYIDLQPVRNIYISSPNVGSFKTVGPRGQTPIKKIPVTADFNQMIFDNTLISNEFLDCSKQTLRTLEFRLTNVDGVEIPFHGSNLSFSIVFDKMNTDS